jgi:hypothetical protein
MKFSKGPKSYGVVNILSGLVHSFHSTKLNAEKQLRLLQAIDRGIPRRA